MNRASPPRWARALLRRIGIGGSAGRPRSAAAARGLLRGERKRVLVVGIYFGARPSLVDDLVERYRESRRLDVEQRWIALERVAERRAVAKRTAFLSAALRPKYELLNRLLAGEELARFDYLVVTDDDALLPRHFLDDFLGVQERLGFAVAQPARTSESFIDLPIVERHPGLLARQTLFVEQGPVISFRRDCLDFVLPFDETSPMGWGLENVWSLESSRRGLTMGIVDAVPVAHALREPVAYYRWEEGDRGRSALFASREHRPTEECFRVVAATPLDERLS